MVIMELLLGPQPLVRPMFTQHTHIVDNMNSVEQCADDREHAKSVEINEGAEYVRKDYVEIKYDQMLDDTSKSPTSGDESSRTHGGNYRSELKRPDLKGSFRCSICAKVFCHSSSLSRHRMQAHFKSYKCTLCRKDITTATVTVVELRALSFIGLLSDCPLTFYVAEAIRNAECLIIDACCVFESAINHFPTSRLTQIAYNADRR
ncbi:unnamed protein product [Angiostrongylus costaricensis]|uniref:C2H2-type domain-containing protein n=1 Tax=Angiostrongylus costaricensis TaxID=334426 RepID=A0A0R3PEJ9_ANGCS|nr:unnamed protein product [Angiostrongylus costaricensis]